MLICRSGNRSLDAGRALEEAGFTKVYNVLHGFEGELDENHHRGAKTGWRLTACRGSSVKGRIELLGLRIE